MTETSADMAIMLVKGKNGILPHLDKTQARCIEPAHIEPKPQRLSIYAVSMLKTRLSCGSRAGQSRLVRLLFVSATARLVGTVSSSATASRCDALPHI